MNENNHLQAIPAEVIQQLRTGLKQLGELIVPYAIALTPQERRELPKMGENSVSVVGKAFELARENPQLVPGFLSMTILRWTWTIRSD